MLRLEAVACRRGERLVFAGLDLALDRGGAILLTGPNGSGKSSLLRLLAALLRPAEGSLTWNGEPIWEEPEAYRAELRYVGHLDAVKPVLTARETLAFWAAAYGAEAGRIDLALEAFALAALDETPGRMLSAGQKRRLTLARLVVSPGTLWLLDEPTVGLDRASVDRLGEEIAAHRADGGMVVLATHTAIELPGAQNLDLGDAAAPAALIEAQLDAWDTSSWDTSL